MQLFFFLHDDFFLVASALDACVFLYLLSREKNPYHITLITKLYYLAMTTNAEPNMEMARLKDYEE